MGSIKKKGMFWGIGFISVLVFVGQFCYARMENAEEQVSAEHFYEVESTENSTEFFREAKATAQPLESFKESEVTEQPSPSEFFKEPEVTEQPSPSEFFKEPEVTEQPSPSESFKEPEVAEQPETTESIQMPEQPKTDSSETEAHVCVSAKRLEEATCLDTGKETIYCIECGKILEEKEIPSLGHVMKMVVWESATCQKSGFYNNICERCGLTESVTEAALPHEVEDIMLHEGNCMEDTVIRHLCKNCGEQVEGDTRYTPQTHSWIETEVDEELVSYCEWCGITR